jgi:hypothetical protein
MTTVYNPLRAAISQSAAEIAIAVLGEPNQRLCSKSELRFGIKAQLPWESRGGKRAFGTIMRTTKVAICFV